MDEQNNSVWRRRSKLELSVMAAIFVFFFYIIVSLIPLVPSESQTNFCPQMEVLYPDPSFANSSKFFEPDYVKHSVDKLSKAVQIPTVSFDDMGEPGEDERYEVFYEFQAYIEKEFPLSVKHGKLETINKHGLLFTFEGTSDLRPLLLMAHQDVVPPGSQEWEYSPFSGYYDGDFLHGRGSADTKNTLVGILEATESLLKQNWVPKRTLLLSFGFDEEVNGNRGAKTMAKELFDRYGRDSLEAIVDEGFGFLSIFGSTVAAPAIAEKGYLDVGIDLYTPGGHSSMPPDHTGIGIMAELAKLLEDNPYKPTIESNNPTLRLFQCLAEHAKHMNKELKRIVLDIDGLGHRTLLLKLLKRKPELLYSLRTTQALDVIRGGVKINALPEKVSLSINHRIAIDSSVPAVMDRIEHFASRIAEKFDLGLYTDGDEVLVGSYGNLTINALAKREPAPISPSEGLPWKWIGGTYRHVLGESIGEYRPEGNIIVSPSIMPAATDTKHFWALTRAIYRLSPVYFEDMVGYHAVNEKLRFRSHLITVAWYYEFILNSTL